MPKTRRKNELAPPPIATGDEPPANPTPKEACDSIASTAAREAQATLHELLYSTRPGERAAGELASLKAGIRAAELRFQARAIAAELAKQQPPAQPTSPPAPQPADRRRTTSAANGRHGGRARQAAADPHEQDRRLTEWESAIEAGCFGQRMLKAFCSARGYDYRETQAQIKAARERRRRRSKP